ncbi:MAG: response regulator [Bdellovibrionota bacterium]
MKPLILYVDDEPHNLAVFEASLPSDWEIKIFDNPMAALEALDKLNPSVIVSDQRMPGVTGVQFLEVAKRLRPDAVRIIVTGYSDENLVVESVRKAQVFDYVKKPWDPDELEALLRRAIEFYNAKDEQRKLYQELQEKISTLKKMTSDLEEAHKREASMRAELECWVPPFVLWALNEKSIQFPIKKDVVGITFDIINSAKIHGTIIGDRPLRNLVIQAFTECVLRHGGWRESHSGDSAYGHFGLFEQQISPFDAALSVAREFRVALRGLSQVHQVQIECGVGLHVARNATVNIHTVQLNTLRGPVIQKSFDTSSSDVDLLHRMEKLVHELPGTNVIMTDEFLKSLKTTPPPLVELGVYQFPDRAQPVRLFMMVSDLVSKEQLEKFKEKFVVATSATPAPGGGTGTPPKAA